MKILKNYVGEEIYTAFSGDVEDKRSSYCNGYIITLLGVINKYIGIVDSVNGKVIEVNKTPVPQFISDDEALAVGYKYFNITEDDCNMAWATKSSYSYPSNNIIYSIQINYQMKDYSTHTINLKPDGTIINVVR